jgi:hypothetical protein
MKNRARTFFRRRDGVLMRRDPDGGIRVATLDETAQYSARSRWWRRWMVARDH